MIKALHTYVALMKKGGSERGKQVNLSATAAISGTDGSPNPYQRSLREAPSDMTRPNKITPLKLGIP